MKSRFGFVTSWVNSLDLHSVRLLIFTLATTVMLLVVSWFPLSLMAFLGLMPSLVVIIMEARASMILFRTVMPLNVLGVAWVYSDIIRQHMNGTLSPSEVVKNPSYWMVILSMVGGSLFLYLVMPRIVLGWYVFKINSEIKLLRRRRVKLRKTWGSELVLSFVEQEGVGSELVDFLLRNGMIEDLEGNLTFVADDAAPLNGGLLEGRHGDAEPTQGEILVGVEPLEPVDKSDLAVPGKLGDNDLSQFPGVKTISDQMRTTDPDHKGESQNKTAEKLDPRGGAEIITTSG